MQDRAKYSSNMERELDRLKAENESLRTQLEDAEETLAAIRSGAVDALVIDTPKGQRVFTLEGAEHPYRALIEQMQEGAVTLFEDGTILYCNQRFADMVQVPMESIIGTRVDRYVLDHDRLAVKSILRRTPEGRSRGEVNLRRAGGEPLPVLVGSSLIEHEGRSALCMVLTDLTERKRAEAILASDRFSRAILNQAADGIVVCDAEGLLVFANQAAGCIADTERRVLISQTAEETWGTAYSPSGERVGVENWPLMRALGGVTSTNEAFRMVRRDGSAYHLLISASPLKEGEDIIGAVATFHDVTEQKKSEERIWASERFHRQVLESIPGMVFTARPDGYCDYQSQQWVDYTGTPVTEHLGDGWNKLLHPDDQPRALTAWRDSVENQAPYNLEYRVRRWDGQYEWFKSIAQPIRDEAGRIIRWFGVALNVQAAKQAEEALRESEEHYRALAELSPDALLVNVDGRFMYANPAAARMMGAQRVEEILGRTPFDFIDPEYHDVVRERIRRILKETGTAPWLEYRWLRLDGSRIEVEVGAVATTWQGKPAIQVVVRDISERKRVQRALQTSENLYRTLFESIDQGFCVIQVLFDEREKPVDYRFVEINPAFERHTGLENALGKTIREMIPDHDEHWFEIYGKVASDGRPARFEKYAAVMKRWFDVYAFRVGQPEDRKVALLFSDVTDRKQMEEQKALLLEAERAARGEAEKLVRLKDEFLATVSHELRSPLSAIVGWTRLMAKQSVEPGKAIEIIDRSASTLNQLVEDLLDMSRIVSGKVRLKRENVDVVKLVSDVVDGVRPAAEAKRIGIEISVASELHPIYCDANRFQQIIWNLLSNAVKFTPADGSVFVTVAESPQELRIDVRDTGQGITPDFLPNLFQRFRQEDGSIARRHGGLGLGLAITKNLIELHGGTIEAHSPGEGKGSTFAIRLPRSAGDPAAGLSWSKFRRFPEPVQVDLNEHTLADVKVLAVDDDPYSRELLDRVLRDAGADVRTARSPDEAWGMLEMFRPDAVISDVGMPDEDGYRFVRGLKGTGDWRAKFPCIAVTALSRPEDRDAALAAGYDEHIGKPFDPGTLCLLIAHHVANATSHLPSFPTRLPANTLTGGADTTDTAEPETCAVPAARPHLLLAEDSPQVAEILKAALEERGYAVSLTDSVSGGVGLARSQPVDLLLADLRLKDGMGWDLMQGMSLVRQVPGIIMSGYSDEVYIAKSKRAGFAEYLVKPVDPDELVKVIERVLRQPAPAGSAT